ncbi:MAG: c-type cytochrome [Planctomycetes bacterium]|nr:c-type cytochrome [Planctomycetota bacterium]
MMFSRRYRHLYSSLFLLFIFLSSGLHEALGELPSGVKKAFRAGAFAIDVSPTEFPVIVNGGMNKRIAEKLLDPLHARCLVLDDGSEQLAIVVVDSCMMPRALLDEAKAIAEQATGIRSDRILISATHTHSAPAVMSCLGSDRDETYTRFLPNQIAKGIKLAQDRLAPARIGWAMGRDEKDVACRRWLMKPGSVRPNPFGQTGERVQMHPGYGNPNAIRPTGPVDPDVAVLSVQTQDGRPLALISNYSMHYVGGPAVSADYFAKFCNEIGKLIGAEQSPQPFVAMLSNGTSGDAWLLDHSKPKRKFDQLSIAKDVAKAAFEAYQKIEYHDWVPLVMEEKLLRLKVRMPSDDDLAQAEAILATAKARQDDKPPTVPEVYAGETVALRQMPPTRELKLQALRLGDLGITAIPNEVYGSTGLTIKKQSPMRMTFNISLANGAEGYIPPPEQHALGGYTTWRARTSCLEVEAEPKIAQAVTELLQSVANQRTQEKPIRSGVSKAVPESVPSPLDARESLDYFHLHDDFRIELVAAEPRVVDPVAYDWGPDGKLWVVEMGDYPLGLDGQGKPGGRIRFLEDTTGDGKYDKSTLFADDLSFPNGISVWRDGVIVTCAPQILYLEDTDHDGRADVQKPLYTGLTEGNPQLRINGLRWGLDGWLYCANGLSTVGKVQSVQTSDKLSLRGRDLRIRPDDGLLDAQLGSTQFGRNRDDWGNWFGVSNGNPMWHFVLADQYLRRNPHMTRPHCRRDVSITPGKAVIYARSAKGIFFHESEVGHFTSANSTIVYRDELFGPKFSPNSFVSEPVNNLIHREVMQPSGVTFTSQRAPEEQRSEFIASSDTWFRPNMIRTGPDGALWIADFYREIIDHPQYIPKEHHARLDFRRGDKLGRIYRVFPKGKKPRPIPTLTGLSGAELAALLDSPNGTLRDMVQKQIVWDKRRDAVDTLITLALKSKRATCRLQSLWTLECLGELTPEIVAQALDDRHPGVRRGAVRLAEGKFEQAPELGAKLLEMVDDPDAPLRLQLACTLGEWRDPRAAQALAKLGQLDAHEPLLIAAVISSIRADNVGAVLESVLSFEGDLPESLVGQLLAVAIGYQQDSVVVAGFETLATPHDQGYTTWQLGALVALSDKLWTQKKSLAEVASPGKLDQLFQFVRPLVGDPARPSNVRVRALRLLGHQGKRGEQDRLLLGSLLVPQESVAIQTAAVDTLSHLGGKSIATLLLENWSSHSPRLRKQILSILLRRTDWTDDVLDKVEQAEIQSGEFDATQRNQLVNHRDAAIRKRADTLLGHSVNVDRQKVVREWEPALALQGDYQKGAAVFTKHCSTCHQLEGLGHVVGPDLAALSDKSPKTLLLSILDPSRSIDVRYLNYVAVTDEGRAYSGILVQESGASITLKAPDGKEQVILRKSLEEMQCTGKSMMPDGLEKDLTPQNLADVMAYVAGPRDKLVVKGK